MTPKEWKELWEVASSEKERAEVEDDMWTKRPKTTKSSGEGSRYGIGQYVAKIVGTSAYGVEYRRFIFKSKHSAVVWGMIDGGMKLKTAKDALVRALTAGPKDEEVTAALNRELRACGKRKKVVRRPGAVKLLGPPETPSRKRDKRKDEDPWETAMEHVCNVMETETDGMTENQRLLSMRELRFKMDIAVSDFRRFVKRERKNESDALRHVRRTELVSACSLLGMEAPKVGEPVDLTLAFRQRGKTARPYHSDVNASRAAKVEFNRIMEAYGIMERYNSELKGQSK